MYPTNNERPITGLRLRHMVVNVESFQGIRSKHYVTVVANLTNPAMHATRQEEEKGYRVLSCYPFTIPVKHV